MKVITTVAQLHEELNGTDKQVVLVPTMGALHEGHLSLVRKAKEIANSFVVISIFVNPTQFGKNEDFDKYPRTLESDLELLSELQPDVVFAPLVSEVYPTGLPEQLSPRAGAIGSVFEGVARPGHFDGMLHVVSWFFEIVKPSIAIFGAKDAQQLYLIKRMVHREFNDSIQIIEAETIREPSGLAKSSRNRFLTANGFETASTIYSVLSKASLDIDQGNGITASLTQARQALESIPLAKLEYLAIVDKQSFKPVDDTFIGTALLLVAVILDGVRLIDNLTIKIQEPA